MKFISYETKVCGGLFGGEPEPQTLWQEVTELITLQRRRGGGTGRKGADAASSSCKDVTSLIDVQVDSAPPV